MKDYNELYALSDRLEYQYNPSTGLFRVSKHKKTLVYITEADVMKMASVIKLEES